MIGDGHVKVIYAESIAVPACEVLNCTEAAEYVMPQVVVEPPHSGVKCWKQPDLTAQESWIYLMVCPNHKDGWWEGDVPTDYPIRPLGYRLLDLELQ
jgi:hypothetical protein